MKKLLLALTFFAGTLLLASCSSEEEYNYEEVPRYSSSEFQNTISETNEPDSPSTELEDSNSLSDPEEIDADSVDVEIYNNVLDDLEEANKRIAELESALEVAQESTSKQLMSSFDERVEYILNVEQTEYPFSCNFGSIRASSWYSDFESALLEARINLDLANDLLSASDFYGACYSSEGNMAFFLGSFLNNQTEFHLVKYDIESQTVQPVTLAKGEYDTYPNDIGRRQGSYITMSRGGNRFRYYYDKNILFAEDDLDQQAEASE
jgi:hypothetical protein